LHVPKILLPDNQIYAQNVATEKWDYVFLDIQTAAGEESEENFNSALAQAGWLIKTKHTRHARTHSVSVLPESECERALLFALGSVYKRRILEPRAHRWRNQISPNWNLVSPSQPSSSSGLFIPETLAHTAAFQATIFHMRLYFPLETYLFYWTYFKVSVAQKAMQNIFVLDCDFLMENWNHRKRRGLNIYSCRFKLLKTTQINKKRDKSLLNGPLLTFLASLDLDKIQ